MSLLRRKVGDLCHKFFAFPQHYMFIFPFFSSFHFQANYAGSSSIFSPRILTMLPPTPQSATSTSSLHRPWEQSVPTSSSSSSSSSSGSSSEVSSSFPFLVCSASVSAPATPSGLHQTGGSSATAPYLAHLYRARPPPSSPHHHHLLHQQHLSSSSSSSARTTPPNACLTGPETSPTAGNNWPSLGLGNIDSHNATAFPAGHYHKLAQFSGGNGLGRDPWNDGGGGSSGSSTSSSSVHVTPGCSVDALLPQPHHPASVPSSPSMTAQGYVVEHYFAFLSLFCREIFRKFHLMKSTVETERRFTF